MLIYQLKPEGAVDNWLLARLRMCFNMLLCQWYVQAAAFQQLTYSYSVTCSNYQFCRNCNYYGFETVRHCGGMTTANLKTGPSGETLNHAMP